MNGLRHSLHFKLLGIIVPLIVFSVGLTAGLFTAISRKSSLVQGREYQRDLCRAIGNQVSGFVDEVRTRAEVLSTVVELGNLDSWEQMILMHSVRDRLDGVNFIALLRSDGVVENASVPKFREIERIYAAQKGNGPFPAATRVWGMVKSELGLPVIYAAAPVGSPTSEKGVLFMEVDAVHFLQVFSDASGIPGLRAEIIDSSGKVLCSNHLQDTFRRSERSYGYLRKRLGDKREAHWTDGTGDRKTYLTAKLLPGMDWVLLLSTPEASLFFHEMDLYIEGGLIAGLMIWVSALLSVAFSRRFLRPLKELHRSTMAISSGDFSAEVPARGKGEIAQLAREFDRMRRSLVEHMERERKAVEDKARLEGLAALGEAASKVNHEIGNRLTNIAMWLDLHREQTVSESDRKFFEAVERNVEKIDRLCRDLSRFSRARRIRPEPLPLGPFLNSVLDQNAPLLAKNGVKADLTVEPGLPLVEGDPGLLEHVFDNLVTNAVDAMPEGGIVRISARAEQAWVAVEIRDSGPGVSEELRVKVFDPFFSTKGDSGTGLGLTIARSVLKAHDGDIEYADYGSGAAFHIRLPVSSRSGLGANAAPQAGGDLPKIPDVS